MPKPRPFLDPRSVCLALMIRIPRINELHGLSDLCFRSKAVWGYDAEFMQACRGELSFRQQDLEQTHVAVAEENGRILGVVQIKISADEAELLKLFIEPEVLQRGIGGRSLPGQPTSQGEWAPVE